MKWFRFVKRAVEDFLEDNCMSSGAALAYYTIFALPPLLVMVFYIASLAGVSQERVSQVVSNQLGLPTAAQGSQQGGGAAGGASLGEVAGREAAGRTETKPPGMLESLGPVAKVAGIVLLVFSATGVFAQLQFALNRAWEVEPDPEQGGILNFLTKRVLSLGMILAIAFLLLVSLVLSTLIDEIIAFAQGTAPGAAVTALGMGLNALATLVVATILFALMFRFLPDARVRWRDVWAGAFITALLFVVGKTLLGWYLQSSEMGASWGSAAASMVTLLVWVYYTSLLVLLGAEMTQVWANQFGRGIRPAEGAVRSVERKEHVRGGKRQQAT